MSTLLENPAMKLFGLTYMILVLKMIAVGYSTSFYRIRDKHFATPEDYELQGLKPKEATHVDVERTRRAHRNDLENILPYFGVGLFYALSGPSMTTATIFFVGFTVARILHSVFYLMSWQPWRTIAFGIGQIIVVIMAISLILQLV